MNTTADIEKYRQAVIHMGVLSESPLITDYSPPAEPIQTSPSANWLNFRGPIRTQGLDASCASYGTQKVYEMEHFRLTGEQLDTSERFSYNLARITDEIPTDFVAQRGTTLRAAARVLRHYGVCDESDWPYVPGDRTHLDIPRFLEILLKARKRRIAEYRNLLKDGVNDSTLSVIRRALRRRPVVCGLIAHARWLTVGADGFIAPGDEWIGGHAVALAFYDDHLRHNGICGWFGFVNSWSESWGDHGIGYIDYNSFLQTLISCYEIVLGKELASHRVG